MLNTYTYSCVYISILCFPVPGWQSGKEPVNAGHSRDTELIPLRKIPGGGNVYALHYSCLENLMDRGTWQATVHEVAESGTIE